MFEEHPQVQEALERSLGNRGTYMDAHVLAVHYLREKQLILWLVAGCVVGWLIVFVQLSVHLGGAL
jgi:hypothetical protein